MKMIKTEDFAALAEVQVGATNSTDVFKAIEAVIRERIGFGLLTMLMLTEDGDEVQRLYTTDPVRPSVTTTFLTPRRRSSPASSREERGSSARRPLRRTGER